MAESKRRNGGYGRLTLEGVIEDLVTEGHLTDDDQRLLGGLYSGRDLKGRHAIEIIADRDWPDAARPERRLTLEWLTEWVAAHAELPFVRIDPLRVDVSRITGVMSYAYAKRFNILALEVGEDEVTIATAEPYEREWEKELGSILKCSIRRVIANPRDIEPARILDALTLGARAARRAIARPGHPSRTWSSSPNWVARASWMRTTSTSSASSTGCCSTPSINAPAISISNPAASSARSASGSMACCITSMRSRPR